MDDADRWTTERMLRALRDEEHLPVGRSDLDWEHNAAVLDDLIAAGFARGPAKLPHDGAGAYFSTYGIRITEAGRQRLALPDEGRPRPAQTPGGSAHEENTTAWNSLTDGERGALSAAWRGHVPPAVSAIHARWWQLETWLRSLVYMELRSRYGADWVQQLTPRAAKIKAKDATSHRYMSTPDATDHLAYLDVGELFPIVTEHWDLFEPSLLDRPVWDGRVDELNKIRRRIAHCRRPHADDLNRLEQTLRDLDGGAYRAMAAYNRREIPPTEMEDPLVRQWIRGEASGFHIVDHARQQYGTKFVLQWSRRPWAVDAFDENAPISGTAGCLWHACWYGASIRNLAAWWRNGYLDIDRWRDLIIYVCADQFSIQVSFAACDDPMAIADGIGHCFQPVLQLQARGASADSDRWDAESEAWNAGSADRDPRVQVNSGWNVLDDSTFPVTVFGA